MAIYTRMARLAVNADYAAVVIYRTNTVWVTPLDGRKARLENQRKIAPGLYRCNISYGGGMGQITVRDLRAVDINRELAALDRSAGGTTYARTGSPGVLGFQERASASTSAGRARRAESGRIARVIREHLGVSEHDDTLAKPSRGLSTRKASSLAAAEKALRKALRG